MVLTVCSLVLLANQQMEQLFQEYLQVQPAVVPGMDMGAPEHMFLMSVHRSLLWVGLFFVLLGLVLSYFLARNITMPLQELSRASGGSGIGLSLARQFVEIHGGEILARNRETGGLSICIGMPVGVKHSTEG